MEYLGNPIKSDALEFPRFYKTLSIYPSRRLHPDSLAFLNGFLLTLQNNYKSSGLSCYNKQVRHKFFAEILGTYLTQKSLNFRTFSLNFRSCL